MSKKAREIEKNLTKVELTTAQKMATFLRKRVGSDMGVKSEYLSEKFSNSKITLTGRKVRTLINYIRHAELTPNLIHSSNGYYTAPAKEATEKYCAGIMKRADELYQVANTLLKQSKKLPK